MHKVYKHKPHSLNEMADQHRYLYQIGLWEIKHRKPLILGKIKQ